MCLKSLSMANNRGRIYLKDYSRLELKQGEKVVQEKFPVNFEFKLQSKVFCIWIAEQVSTILLIYERDEGFLL